MKAEAANLITAYRQRSPRSSGWWESKLSSLSF